MPRGRFETIIGDSQLNRKKDSSGPRVSGWASSDFIFNSSNAVSSYQGPHGGPFIVADGVEMVFRITQQINNLVVGQTDQLGFWWALA